MSSSSSFVSCRRPPNPKQMTADEIYGWLGIHQADPNRRTNFQHRLRILGLEDPHQHPTSSQGRNWQPLIPGGAGSSQGLFALQRGFARKTVANKVPLTRVPVGRVDGEDFPSPILPVLKSSSRWWQLQPQPRPLQQQQPTNDHNFRKNELFSVNDQQHAGKELFNLSPPKVLPLSLSVHSGDLSVTTNESPFKPLEPKVRRDETKVKEWMKTVLEKDVLSLLPVEERKQPLLPELSLPDDSGSDTSLVDEDKGEETNDQANLSSNRDGTRDSGFVSRSSETKSLISEGCESDSGFSSTESGSPKLLSRTAVDEDWSQYFNVDMEAMVASLVNESENVTQNIEMPQKVSTPKFNSSTSSEWSRLGRIIKMAVDLDVGNNKNKRDSNASFY